MLKLLWFIIGLTFIFCPDEYSRSYCSINLITFLLFWGNFIKIKNKQNFWDFDSLFLLIFFITSYIYPVFIYNESYPFLPFFNNGFNINNIPKGVIASTIAGCLYMQGSLSESEKFNKTYNNYKINNSGIIIAAIIFCFLFFYIGGLNHYISKYNSFAILSNTQPKGLTLQLEILAFTCIISALGIDFYNIPQNTHSYNISNLYTKFLKKNELINWTLLIVSLSFAIPLAIVGNRTIGLAIIITIIYIIANRFYNIKFKTFVLMIVVGFIAMFSIQITRAGYQFNSTYLAFDNIISDFIIPSRSNFLVYEVIEDKGISLGITMLSPLISVIPTLDSFLDSIGIDFVSSPLYFTNYTDEMGYIVRTGLGTTLQADVMLAFGWPGLSLFYILGKYVNFVYKKMEAGHLYYHIIYLCLISMSVYWVRAEFTYPTRLIIWSVVITYLSKLFTSKNKIK